MTFQVSLEARELHLRDDGHALMVVPLDQGGRFRIMAPDDDTIETLIPVLEAVPGVAVLTADGGLLGAMTVSANLSLALRYGVQTDAAMVRDWAYVLDLALRLCGVSEERVNALARTQPMRLDRTERWMVGFVRHLLCPAELLVLDRVFAGLSRRQAEALIALEKVYHEFHPFRPTLFVDLDAHGLPELPSSCSTLELEARACPS